MDWLRIRAFIFAAKRMALPILFGAIVGWLIRHNHGEWVPVVCSIADALAISVTECVNYAL